MSSHTLFLPQYASPAESKSGSLSPEFGLACTRSITYHVPPSREALGKLQEKEQACSCDLAFRCLGNLLHLTIITCVAQPTRGRSYLRCCQCWDTLHVRMASWPVKREEPHCSGVEEPAVSDSQSSQISSLSFDLSQETVNQAFDAIGMPMNTAESSDG